MDEILKQIRILYVEDDKDIRTVLSRGIGRKVKEIEVASDGEDGLKKYITFKPDIIITDIKMPNMDGLKMCSEIRKLDKEIPIIVTSAHGESDILLEAIDVGITGYIIKPIDKKKLFNTIHLYGKSIILERELKEMCEKLLANPVIQNYKIVFKE